MKCNGFAHIAWDDEEQFDSDIFHHLLISSTAIMKQEKIVLCFIEMSCAASLISKTNSPWTLSNGC